MDMGILQVMWYYANEDFPARAQQKHSFGKSKSVSLPYARTVSLLRTLFFSFTFRCSAPLLICLYYIVFLYFFTVSFRDTLWNARGGARTLDPLIKSQVLFQLSYAGLRAELLREEVIKICLCPKGHSRYRMTPGGIEPTTSGLKGPHRMPLD